LVTYVDPSWSPDGKRIAFARRGETGADIWTIAPDGTGPAQLTPLPECPSSPTEATCEAAATPNWSPDGKRIVFSVARSFCRVQCVNFNADIYSVDRDGGNLVQLTTASLNEANSEPAWSPDGRLIVFTRIRYCGESCTTGDLVVMNADGSNQRQLTFGPGIKSSPDWQPTFKNHAEFCGLERGRLGDAAFRSLHGTNANGSNAFGKCVSQNAGVRPRDRAFAPSGSSASHKRSPLPDS
jgi:Tol biopolymer transport system component